MLKQELSDRRKESVAQEHRQNFGKGKGKHPSSTSSLRDYPSKRSKVAQSWTHVFLCVSSRDATTAPRKVSEKQMLIEAGLWEKRISFKNIDCSADEYREQLHTEFPKLQDAGGYELMRCIPNSNKLENLGAHSMLSPRATHELVGRSKVYIRPIQKDLDLTPVTSDNLESASVITNMHN